MGEPKMPLAFRLAGWVLVAVLVMGTLLVGGDSQPIQVLIGAMLMAGFSLVSSAWSRMSGNNNRSARAAGA